MRVLVAMLIACCAAQAYADAPYESTDRIKKLVTDLVNQQVSVASDEKLSAQITHLEISSHLPTCQEALKTELPQNNIQKQIMMVSVSCASPNWHVYIPVEVKIEVPVVVAKHNILPHETINESDLDFVTYDKNSLMLGYFKTKDEVIGNLAAHFVTAGSVISKKSLDLPTIVHRNQAITIVAVSNQVSVSMTGIAKADGALNSIIKVTNPSSKRELDAVVIGPNRAQIVF